MTTSPTIAQALESERSPNVAICLDGVSKSYKLYERPFNFFKEALTGRSYHREKVVLSDISLTLRRGEILGIIGRNGAGKSTLLKIIAGTLAPTQGDVTVKGRVAAILELGTGFNANYSGRDNVILSALMRGMSEEAVRRKFDSIVTFAGLEDVIDEPFQTYSSGMQARLAFAAATAVEADVLVIDEALAAGDIRFASRSLHRIHEICQSGVTALFVSHVTYHVMQLCSRVVWIDGGRIRMDGAPLEVVRAYEYEMHNAIAHDEGRVVSHGISSAGSSVNVPAAESRLIEVSAPTDASAPADAVAPIDPSAPTDASLPIHASKPKNFTGSKSASALIGTAVLVDRSASTMIRSSALQPDKIQSDIIATQVEQSVELSDAVPPASVCVELTKESASEATPLLKPTDRTGFPRPIYMEAGKARKEGPAVEISADQTPSKRDKHAASEARARFERFSTDQYRIGKILLLDKDGHQTQIFRIGELMRVLVSYECLLPEPPKYSCGLAVALNRVSDFESIMYFNTNYPHSDEEMRDYFNASFRRYRGQVGKIEAIINPLQVRAGEYYLSLGILPNLPGPHEFYEYLHCHYRINVLANGFDEPSVFYPIVQWTNGPVE